MFVLGLYQEEGRILAALLKKEKKSWKIAELTSYAHLQDVKRLDTYTVTALPPDEVLFRQSDVPLKLSRTFRSALPHHFEKLSPFEPDQSIIIPLLSDSGILTSCYVLRNQSLEDHLAFFEKGGLDPDQVSIVPAAISRFMTHFFPDKPDWIVFYLHGKKGFCLAAKENKIIFSYNWTWGAVEALNKEIQRLAEILQMRAFFPTIPTLVLGKIPDNCHFDSQYFNRLQIASELGDHAIPIGLALDGVESDREKIQLLQKKFSSEKIFKTRSTLIKKYLIISGALLSLFFLAQCYLISHEKGIISKKISPAPSSTSLEAIEKAFSQFQRKIMKSEKPFPFDTQLPNMSQILSEISALPSIENREILSFNYELIEYPKWGGKVSDYRARGSFGLLLTTTQSTEKIVNDLGLLSCVDPNEEILWKEEEGIYYFTFFFKRNYL